MIPELLKGGADPRISNEGGEKPEDVAASSSIKVRLAADSDIRVDLTCLYFLPPAEIQDWLKEWDLNETDRLVAQYQAEVEEKRATELAAAQKKLKGAADELEAAKKYVVFSLIDPFG